MDSVKIENITKTYDKTTALDNLSFEVNRGEIFGLIGPDGAGKTTLIRILVTLLEPDKGDAWIFGKHTIRDYKTLRKELGYMPGRFSLYSDLTVEENMKLFATLFGTSIKENYHLVKDIYSQIEPFKNRRAGDLSGGMKQKLALSCALIHKPNVLVLDEPSTGVDPVSRKELWQMLSKIKNEGITVIVSTPYMDEAAMCDRIALMQSGKIMALDTPQNAVKLFDKPLYSVISANKHQLINDLKKYKCSGSVFPFGESIHYTDKNADCDVNSLYEYLAKSGNKNIEIKKINPQIEDTFMNLMSTHSGDTI